MIIGDGIAGSLRDVTVVFDLLAKNITERLDFLDDDLHLELAFDNSSRRTTFDLLVTKIAKLSEDPCKESPINVEISPGPIALTGDKKEALSCAHDSFYKLLNHDCNTDRYVEQEKLVLVKFQFFLDRIIAHGNVKDKWSTSHGSENLKSLKLDLDW
ncbi:START-like domain superfamily [Forsythia ovata]|uniref:START-like domain superfamily n=1 Tax=Forsythia ovata TaxID=205694 RepID=A0ABD1WZG0_9LAMI